MSRETERLKAEARAMREGVQRDVEELGDRIIDTRPAFMAGIIAGVLMLLLLNSTLFRPFRRRRSRRRCG